ncbi:MAG TPA: glutathione S-transferase family protein [Hyphomicrobiaceae bacterium]|nr:glutathione S-transferase family protein [Hyphomicrobiaceae bacterium]
MLTLYHGSVQTCSLATHIALEEAGANYTTVRLDMANNQQRSAEYLAINPKGRVPALVTDRGILTENVALLYYVAQIYPAAKLAPADPFDLAKMQAFNAWLASTVHVNHAHKMRGSRWSDDPAAQETMKAKVASNMTDCAALIETDYLASPWVMGSQYTVADPYLYVMELWMESDGVDMKKFPKITAHRAAMEARPAVRTVLSRYA